MPQSLRSTGKSATHGRLSIVNALTPRSNISPSQSSHRRRDQRHLNRSTTSAIPDMITEFFLELHPALG
ncbi:hypothetical protein EVAR_62572_1 [Eumeta japonica]|uniref:Uncharacterized protein n=1 Tax=Eumeta variegata TaxID=151549 RepID=A0A4C1YMN7_EUMVA|nr:hypothetical protein EVAR_62572_1 [Eumeta japonica]